MALLDEIGTILSTQSVASSSGEGVGWYLALSMMPDSTASPDRIVAVIPTPGSPPLADQVELDEPGVQIRVRGQSYMSASTAFQEAWAKAEDAYAILHGLAPGTYSGRYYAGVWAEQSPFLLRYDENNRPEVAFNLRVYRSRTT